MGQRHKTKWMKWAVMMILPYLLSACMLGPNYKRPCAVVPAQYKEISKKWKKKEWKVAEPRDLTSRGAWWKIFHDPELNALEDQLNASNQSIATAIANYQNALELVEEARASFFPVVTAAATLSRVRQGSSGAASFNSVSSSSSTVAGSPGSSTGIATSGSGGGKSPVTVHSLLLSANWVPDIWGQVRRTVEASEAGAQSSHALLAATRLSQQGSLAQYYFQLRSLDTDQMLLDKTVSEYKKYLKYTLNRYHTGVAAEADVVQARSQLESAEASAIDNKVNRAKIEHAIAVLMGQPPAFVTIAQNPLKASPPSIPIDVPSELLERRPDVAEAERLMAQANANIGVAMTAFFPTLTLTGNTSVAGQGLGHWFSLPALNWSLGSQLAETVFDGGLRAATVRAAKATYHSTVASYRQTVLTALQNVEDNLSSLRILDDELIQQRKAAASAKLALKLVTNQYLAGTVDYSSVITAQNTAFAAQKNADDVNGLRMTAAAGLIQALGGGWCEQCLYG